MNLGLKMKIVQQEVDLSVGGGSQKVMLDWDRLPPQLNSYLAAEVGHTHANAQQWLDDEQDSTAMLNLLKASCCCTFLAVNWWRMLQILAALLRRRLARVPLI